MDFPHLTNVRLTVTFHRSLSIGFRDYNQGWLDGCRPAGPASPGIVLLPCLCEGLLMRFKNFVTSSTLAAFVATSAIGCGQGTDVALAPAPQIKPAEPGPLPKDPQKGGGGSSSGNMKRNPGADPLAPK